MSIPLHWGGSTEHTFEPDAVVPAPAGAVDMLHPVLSLLYYLIEFEHLFDILLFNLNVYIYRTIVCT